MGYFSPTIAPLELDWNVNADRTCGPRTDIQPGKSLQTGLVPHDDLQGLL